MSNKILVTGGAGYIGSHTVKQLGEAGYDIVIYDNLSTGSAASILYGKLIVGNLEDRSLLRRVFAEYNFKSVLHFAASISVPESIANPLDYYANNTANTLNLLQCCQDFGIDQLVFSSTAAVYGEPQENPVTETAPTLPMNPYGRSKLMSEQIIQDYSKVSQLRYVILRYFNVAGADTGDKIGQYTRKAEHLIKVGCDAALNRRPSVSIFGQDFPTPDGSGIRDYIHVEDLAKAHLDALRYLEAGNESQIFNCGYGQGYSVKEVLEKIKEVSEVDFPIIEAQRRAGDPACVIACADKIRTMLGWQPKYNNLDIIIRTAFNWEKKLIELSQLEKNLAQHNFKLGMLLSENQIISQTQLKQVLLEQQESDNRLGELLLEKGWISPSNLERFLLEQNYRKQGVWLKGLTSIR